MTTATRIAPRNHLSAKQEAFCVFYFQTRHGTNSALQAGYSPRSAYAIAEENLNKPEIQARIAELQAKVESAAIADVSERKQRLTTFLRANLVDFLDKDGNPAVTAESPGHQAVSEFEVTSRIDAVGEVTIRKRLKLRDPIAAIQELNRMERIGATESTVVNFNEIKILVTRAEPKQLP